jgi:hypothetical protein
MAKANGHPDNCRCDDCKKEYIQKIRLDRDLRTAPLRRNSGTRFDTSSCCNAKITYSEGGARLKLCSACGRSVEGEDRIGGSA